MLRTIDDQLTAADGRPAGFDYMRLLLAIGVVMMHSIPVAYGDMGNTVFWQSHIAAPFRFILPMFFALSGFLVMGSYERSRTLVMFFGLRVIRIWPALLVEVLLSAMLLGPLLTTYSLGQYFGDPLFARYFLNMLGEPQYVLPGLFATNPNPDVVNGQLWTVPFELACYIVLGLIGVAGLQRKRMLAPLAAIGLTLVYVAYRAAAGQEIVPGILRPVAGPLLVVSFLIGVSGYLYRKHLPATPLWGLASLVLGYLFLLHPYTQLLAIWPIGYLTVWLGTLNPRRVELIKGADYSYGIFLYGYPIQQTLAWSGEWAQNPVTNTVATLIIASGFSALSWRLIEEPALRLRRPMKKLEDRWLAFRRPAAA